MESYGIQFQDVAIGRVFFDLRSGQYCVKRDAHSAAFVTGPELIDGVTVDFDPSDSVEV